MSVYMVLLTCVCIHSDVFKMDPEFLENEEKYKTIKKGENVHRYQALPNQLSAYSQLNQSTATSSGQISWTRAAAIRGRREMAATRMRTMRMRTRREMKVKHTYRRT